MTSHKIRGVFFDAGNTLLRVHPSVGAVYANTARMFGVEITSETIETSFKILWNQTAPLVTNEGHRLSYDKERDWWKHLVQSVFAGHFEPPQFELFFEYLYGHFMKPECWRLYDDVLDVLNYLRTGGYRLAIISNWDSRLPSLCELLGIQDFFETMVVSSIVGYEKPHPTIFQIALERMDLAPGDVMYIGDDPFLDYQAARNVGIQALHLDRHQRFPEHPDRITSLREVIAFVGK